MKYSFYISIISILFSLVANIFYEPVALPFEVNDGEVRNVGTYSQKYGLKLKSKMIHKLL